MLLLLEPDAERVKRFQEVMRQFDPDQPVMTWRNAATMIREMTPHLEAASLISLEHDLVQEADGVDPGDGLDVAKFLVSQPVVRPVVIHSGNKARAARMAEEFERAGWPYSLVPHVGTDWIEIGWKRAVKRVLKPTDRPRISTRAEYWASLQRRAFFIVLCLFVASSLAAFVYNATRKSPRSFDEKDQAAISNGPEELVKPVSPIADTPPDFILEPEDFYKELKANKTAATEKYKGKVIQLTGVLNKYLKTLSGKVELNLLAPGYILDIQCYTTDPEPWTTAVPCQTVTLKGRFPDKFIIPQLRDCVILKVTGENSTTFTVIELARAYDSDPKGFMDEYYDTCLIISGVVESKTEDDGLVAEVHVTFKTDSNVKVVADFLKWGRDADRLKVGEPARIVGRFSGDHNSEPDILNLWACFYAGRVK